MLFHTYDRKLSLKWESHGELKKTGLNVMRPEFLAKPPPPQHFVRRGINLSKPQLTQI